MNHTAPADVHHRRFDPTHDAAVLMKSSIGRLISGTIRIDLESQRVLLSGDVASWYDKQLAQELIRPFVDSGRIENRIRVSNRL